MKKKFLFVVLAFLAFFALFFFVAQSEYRFEKRIQDLFIKTFAKFSDSKNKIHLVIIDDKSTDRVRYPWARDMYADIFAYLIDYAKAKLVVFDAVIVSYDEYHPNGDKIFFEEIKKFDNLVAGYNILLNEYSKNFFMPVSARDELFKQKTQVKVRDERTFRPPENMMFSNFPPEYLKNIKHLGHVQIKLDFDGVLRTSIPLKNYKGELYPSLALEAYSMLTGVNDFVLTDKFLCSADGCKTFKMPIKTLRDKAPNVYASVNWYRIKNRVSNVEFSYEYASAIDIYDSYHQILKGEKPVVDPAIFKDKIVFVGGCANNELVNDKKITPVSTIQAGVDYQATVFENMLTQKFMVKFCPILNLFIILFMGILTLLAIRKSNLKIALVTMAILFTIYYISAVVLIWQRMIMMLLTPAIVQFFVFAGGYAYQFIIEDRTKRKLQKAMGQYISKDVVDKVVQHMDKIDVGGKRADVTVMFVDIRGFTTISEQLPPEEVTEILNAYISAVEPLIRKHKGVLNKFIGDAIMAIFGEPIQNPNHAESAVRCADEVLKKIKKLQTKWMEEGKPKVEIGVALCSGEVFVGNIGSAERLEYTVIGDVVNTASRIESFNKFFKTKFLISQQTYSRVRDFVDVIMIKDVEIRGKMQKVNIYEVLRVLGADENV